MKNIYKKKGGGVVVFLALAVALVFGLVSCTSTGGISPTVAGALIGAGVGAGLGAVIGNESGHARQSERCQKCANSKHSKYRHLFRDSAELANVARASCMKRAPAYHK